MKKTFLMTLVNTDVLQHTGAGFLTVPERTVFLNRHVSFWVRR